MPITDFSLESPSFSPSHEEPGHDWKVQSLQAWLLLPAHHPTRGCCEGPCQAAAAESAGVGATQGRGRALHGKG